jgi:hypothetical protein
MNIPSLVRNLRIYVRAEVIAAESRLGARLRQTGWIAVALALLVMALVMANIALFAALSPVLGPVWTPLSLALGNLVLALAFVMVAVVVRPGPELALAEDLRRASAQAIEDDLHARSGVFGGLGGQMMSAGAAQMLVPTLSLVVGTLKRKKT